MLRISQPKIQWQSWPPSADILPCKHIVLSCFAMTAFVANTPTFAGHPSNLALLGRTDESASDWTLHNSPKSQLASKTCSVGYPQHHYQQMSREGARAVVHRFQGFAQNRCQARCAPNRAPRGILLCEDSVLHHPTNASTSLDGAPSLPVDISITHSQLFPLPLCNTQVRTASPARLQSTGRRQIISAAVINHTRTLKTLL